jgi:hypothetical protein
VTGVSWRVRVQRGASGENLVRPRILAAWHALCFPVLASGCFYIGPIPTVEYNLPPEIKRAEPASDTEEPLLIGPSGQSVFVIAEDPEGDEVRFTWTLTGEGILGYGYPVYDGEGSEIVLEHDPELDGKTLGCLLDDGENDLVSLSWLLEVL